MQSIDCMCWLLDTHIGYFSVWLIVYTEAARNAKIFFSKIFLTAQRLSVLQQILVKFRKIIVVILIIEPITNDHKENLIFNLNWVVLVLKSGDYFINVRSLFSWETVAIFCLYRNCTQFTTELYLNSTGHVPPINE